MTEYLITLTPDETRLVLALQPGETMTLTRSIIGASVDDMTDYSYPSLLGQPGDVLMAPLGKPHPDSDNFDWTRFTVVSIVPRIDGDTWVVDAKVRKEK